MRLFHETLDREFAEIQERNIRVVFSGRREELDRRMRARMEDAEERTRANTSGVLHVCLNYGGRAEIVDAVKRLVADGAVPDEAAISTRLYQPWLPDPDLIIRTAGERRTSNFLLWQAAYAELHVTETLWPDFGVEDLNLAVADYQGRVRRFGGRPEAELG
jgi:undecaprenyl diphosphate synthase